MRPTPDSYRSKQGDIKLRIDTPVVVTAGLRDAAFPLQHAEVVRSYPKLPSGFRNVYAVHMRTA
jgi:hypothetical protein